MTDKNNDRRKIVRVFLETLDGKSPRFVEEVNFEHDPKLGVGLLVYREAGFPEKLSPSVSQRMRSDGSQMLHSFALLYEVEALMEWSAGVLAGKNFEKLAALSQKMLDYMDRGLEPRLIFWQEEDPFCLCDVAEEIDKFVDDVKTSLGSRV